MFAINAVYGLSSYLWPVHSQMSLEQRVSERCQAWSWSCTLSSETSALTTLFKDRLHKLDAERKAYEPQSSERFKEIINELKLAKRFAQAELGRGYSLVWPSDRKQLARLRGLQSIILLQADALLDAFKAQDPAPELDAYHHQQLESFVRKGCQEQLASARSYPLNSEALDEFEALYQGLGEHNGQREAMLRAIEAYRKATKGSAEPQGRDPHAMRADTLLLELKAKFTRYIPALLNTPELRERFSKQVIRDELNLEVFFEHPYVADFLRRHEALEKSVAAAGHRVEVGSTSKIPEILLDGALIPIRSLPGYEGGFRNVGGWHSMGLDYRSKHYPLQEAIAKDKREGLETSFVYTASGLTRFNPRTWCMQAQGKVHYIDPRQEQWWRDLPAYKTEWIVPESDYDEGYRLETLTMRTQEGPQAGNAHAFSCVIMPTGKRRNNQIEVAYYPSGEYAYLYSGGFSALKNMHAETHVLSDQCMRNQSERHFVWYQQPVTKNEAIECMKQIGRERINSLEESAGNEAPSFSLTTNNCSSSAARIARAAGRVLPLALPFGAGMTGFKYAAASLVHWIPPLKWAILWGFGHHTVLWDLVIDNSYALSIYLWMKRRTDALSIGADKLQQSRIPLLPGRRWEHP